VTNRVGLRTALWNVVVQVNILEKVRSGTCPWLRCFVHTYLSPYSTVSGRILRLAILTSDCQESVYLVPMSA